MSNIFHPVASGEEFATVEMFITNNNSQLYLSAAASRFLGDPDEVVFLASEVADRIIISTADDYPSPEVTKFRVSRRKDSRAGRIVGVPRFIMKNIKGRVDASFWKDGHAIIFDLGVSNE